ncbi:DPBB and LysM peptidoglycan-binding domain-containing protein [Companilactobacillus pabuli]|uniref:LysM peptidoglycan-binding domain-containing protein n=1 Tax=Companilactobacillus pabuli TaxID=2714036 RepID=A0A7L7KUZ7_9LACO|nr:LysM peptidoglycan-binding domain-containing protein [Companilactobacillus pabuli]MDG5113635.1 LysM peptidoglycan-binding domain-containing protein [Companilactobacillus pabuli]QMT83643.1 LysM peptidoglycan-binding domain-containing protein [Companilactobacillus pabuli]
MKKVLSIALVSAMALSGILASTSNTVQAAVNNGDNTVTVEKGDTYKSIAEANGISISALEQANGREVGGFDLIFPGETITLPGATTTTDTTATTNTDTDTTTDTSAQATDASQQTQSQTATTQAATDTTSQSTDTNTNSTQSTSTTGTSQGTFKISFYDPSVLGSNMGYSGVAANLSVFPKGTQLKITLADGTVLYRTVNDTGTFANSNSQQLDVAMPSSSIPSYGVTTASVEVLS